MRSSPPPPPPQRDDGNGGGENDDAATPAASASWATAAHVLVALVAVSIGAASFAMAFRMALQLVYTSLFDRRDVLGVFLALPRPARFALPVCGSLAAGVVARIAAKRSIGQGMGHVMEAVVFGKTRLSIRATTWKALGSWLAIGFGNSIGREGPLIQFGASLGSRIASSTGIPSRSARALVAAGTAAGFAAAYNTPLAAILFVVEIVSGGFALESLAMVLMATAISTALVRATVGGGPIYGDRVFSISSTTELVAHAILGVIVALAAQLFMLMLTRSEALFDRTKTQQPWRAAIGGSFVGLLAIALPEVTGNGYEPLNLLLDGRYSVGIIAVLVVAKALTTTASVSSGSPGGVFTPSLFLGGGVGMMWGHFVVAIELGGVGSPGSYALVGMAAMIAATTHAPLMASVLVFELSGDYAVVLPLVLATAVATIVSRHLRRDSIYAAELRRGGVESE